MTRPSAVLALSKRNSLVIGDSRNNGAVMKYVMMYGAYVINRGLCFATLKHMWQQFPLQRYHLPTLMTNVNWKWCYLSIIISRIVLLFRHPERPPMSFTKANFTMQLTFCRPCSVDSSSRGQNGPSLADVIFKCIFLNEKFCSLICILLQFVSNGPMDNKPALVQVMVWRRTGERLLPEPLLTLAGD